MVVFAAGYLGIAFAIAGTPMFIHMILNPEDFKSSSSVSTDDMIADLKDLTEDIYSILKDFDLLSDWNNARDDIQRAKNTFDDAVEDDRGDFEELKAWADDDQIK